MTALLARLVCLADLLLGCTITALCDQHGRTCSTCEGILRCQQ